MTEQLTALILASREARENAYAPYSGFRVGAALLSKDGRIFSGCNVENVSFGLCNCAERTAIFSAIAAGCRPGDFTHLVVIAEGSEPVAPCGACRQVMMEIGGADLIVIQTTLDGIMSRATMRTLLPGAFTKITAQDPRPKVGN